MASESLGPASELFLIRDMHRSHSSPGDSGLRTARIRSTTRQLRVRIVSQSGDISAIAVLAYIIKELRLRFGFEVSGEFGKLNQRALLFFPPVASLFNWLENVLFSSQNFKHHKLISSEF